MRYDITIPQGATWEIKIPVLDASGNPQSLTGWSAASQIRAYHAAPTVLHSFTPTFEGSNVVLTVTAATSSTWPWRSGVYDVELTAPDGKTIRLAEGHVTVTPEVTR